MPERISVHGCGVAPEIADNELGWSFFLVPRESNRGEGKVCESTAKEVSFEWSYLRILSIYSKVKITYKTNSTI